MDSEIELHLKVQTVKAIAPVIHRQFGSLIFARIPPSQKSPDKSSI
ncbi:MAG TPA: hypothetical protein VFA61_01045 [Candidatus Udaeobacter sp.]|nr:hypothetical protein [Candidatus Udaeobacter sp.]